MDKSLISDILASLECFSGENSIKTLFWELLSFDQVHDSIVTTRLPSDTYITSLRVFASRGNIKVLTATAGKLERYEIERICRQIKKDIPVFILVVNRHRQNSWTAIYPDETKKEFLRILALPGLPEDRLQTATILASLAPSTQESSDWLEVSKQLEIFFPGGMPRSNPDFGNLELYVDRVRPQLKHMYTYLEDMARLPLLTNRQEWGEDLRPEYIPSDGSAMNFQEWRLTLHNLRLVIYWASQMPCEGLEIDDLIQEGNIGLMVAAEKFDPSLRNRFSTFASYWICARMLRAIEENWSLFHWPSYKAFSLIRANLAGEIEHLGLGERRERHFDLTDQTCELIEDPEEGSEEQIELMEIRGIVRKAVGALKERDREVIKKRFGFDNDQEMTLEQIGNLYGFTREHIRQIEAKALTILERNLTRELGESLLPQNEIIRKRKIPKLRVSKHGIRGRFTDKRYYAH